jgi:serine phosphatase RsbU (regulator of sigma subunit)
VCCGHPPPLLVAADGSSEELDGPIALPLGLPDTHARTFERGERYLYSGDRVILYSDGITERRTATARFGVDGLLAAVRSAKDTSSVATAAAIETAVLGASDERMSDDATQLILRIA